MLNFIEYIKSLFCPGKDKKENISDQLLDVECDYEEKKSDSSTGFQPSYVPSAFSYAATGSAPDSSTLGNNPLFLTFHRCGPSLLTTSYPVDTDVIKEIISENGIIGPEKYKACPGALKAIEDCDNVWFFDDDKEEVRQMYLRDLLTLATKHGMAGAYSLLGAHSDNLHDMTRYFEKGALLGNKECMADYAVTLYCDGRTSDGFMWLKRSADAGCKTACLFVALSYHYGTLSEINLDKAAEYYVKGIGDDCRQFYCYLNLASMMIECGYFHTAYNYYKKMEEASRKDDVIDLLRDLGDFDEYMGNLPTCERLLSMPYQQRLRYAVVQEHSRRLDSLFCTGYVSPAPFVPEHVSVSYEDWIPSPELIDIDPADLEEVKQKVNIFGQRETDEHEDYMFLSIPVKITNPEIHGTQQELIFLEKYGHSELNKYIQGNLTSLKSRAKSLGYIFVYLPSHQYDLVDAMDRLGSYVNDGEDILDHTADLIKPKRTEQDYWKSLVPEQALPDDCAGFLHYVPDLNDRDNASCYEYYLFPYRAGTDWSRAFNTFFDLIRNKPVLKSPDFSPAAKQIPSGSYLVLSTDYEFTLRDSCDAVLAEIKMPTLSKVLYMLLLKHPEGIVIKKMSEYSDELWEYYQAMGGEKARRENIDLLCDPTSNSFNEKISRIRSSFTKALEGHYKDDLDNFLPIGKRGEAYSVSLDRQRFKIKIG